MGDPKGRNTAIDWIRLTGEVGWVLLPLRAFLAVVYLDGGISKIADSRFLDDSAPQSMHASVLAVKANSPIGGLLGPVVDHSFAFGVLMAVGELAVGLGILFGLWTRIAAGGGILLALSLWLTVSWGADPWFTSADLVYVFALTPLLIAGSAAVFSLDGWLARAMTAHPGRGEDRTRRAMVTGGAGLVGLVVLGAASLTRRSSSPRAAGVAPSPTLGSTPASASGSASASSVGPKVGVSAGSATAASTSAPPATGPTLVKASEVPVGGGKQVTDPTSGDPAWVLQLSAGSFTAYSAVCPHEGCAVNFVSGGAGFSCPCHGSRFSSTGQVRNGPATRGLSRINVAETDGVVKRA